MSVLARLDFLGAITAPGYAANPVVFDAIIDPTGQTSFYLPAFSATVDTSVLTGFFPRLDGRHQVVGRISVTIDGSELLPNQILDSFEFSESESGAITWSFGVPYFSSLLTDQGELFGNTKFNDPLRPGGSSTSSINYFHGPPPGGSSVDIDIVTPTAGGSTLVSLVKDGIAENAELKIGEEGAVMWVNGTGPLQRLDQKLVSLVIPAGHGLTLGKMVSFVLRETAAQNEDDWDYELPIIPDFFIVDDNGLIDDRLRYKEIQVVDRPGLEVANELLEIAGHRLVIGPDGKWKLNVLFDEPSKEYDWAFNLQDLYAEGGLALSPSADGPPIVTVEGASQDVDDGTGGLEQEYKELTIGGDYVRSYPEWEIDDTAGTLVTTGDEDVARTGTYYKVKTWLNRQGDTLVSERTEIFDLYNPEQAAGTIDGSGVATYTVGKKIDDDGRCVTDSYDRFRQTATEITWHEYEDLYGDGREFLTVTEFNKFGYYNQKEATMLFSSGSWAYRNGVKIEWDGDGVYTSDEDWQVLEYKGTRHTIDEDGFLTSSKTVEVARWALDPGTKYAYTDGRTSADSFEKWTNNRTIMVTYTPTDEESHSKTTTEWGPEGKKITVETGLEGYLPAAAMKTTVRPTQLSDGTPLPDAMYASSNLTTEFEATYKSAALLAERPAWEHRTTSSVAEDVDDGMVLARRILKELATIPVDAEIPWNPLIHSTDKVKIDVGQAGEYDLGVVTMKVTERRLSYDRATGVARTALSGKIYAV